MSKGTYRQAIRDDSLSLERGTTRVPDDGNYHVLVDGVVVFSTKSFRQARDHYSSLRGETSKMPPLSPDERLSVLRREAGDRESRAFLAQSAREKRARATERGGKGGPGGVNR